MDVLSDRTPAYQVRVPWVNPQYDLNTKKRILQWFISNSPFLTTVLSFFHYHIFYHVLHPNYSVICYLTVSYILKRIKWSDKLHMLINTVTMFGDLYLCTSMFSSGTILLFAERLNYFLWYRSINNKPFNLLHWIFKISSLSQEDIFASTAL
jgi:hypothetical protein